MTIPTPQYRIGAVVYHCTNDEPRVVRAYVIYGTHMAYRVANAYDEKEYVEGELTNVRPNWESSIPEVGDEE